VSDSDHPDHPTAGPSRDGAQASVDAAAEAEQAVADAGADDSASVRERIRAVVERAAAAPGRAAQEGAGSLERVVGDVLDGAARGARTLADDRQGTALAETLEGLSDGLTRTANATKLAIEEAASRGKAFADDDLRHAADDLRAIERLLRESGERLARGLGDNLRQGAGDLADHASRAADALAPAVESAISAAARNPVAFAGQSASAGVEAARMGAGALFEAAGGLLGSLGKAMAPDRTTGEGSQRAGGDSDAADRR